MAALDLVRAPARALRHGVELRAGQARPSGRGCPPVLDEASEDLSGTRTSIILSDERGHVVQRRVSERGLRSRLDHILLAPGFSYSEEHIPWPGAPLKRSISAFSDGGRCESACCTRPSSGPAGAPRGLSSR